MNKMKDIKELTFEQALSELEEIVEKLEQGDIDLEDSIDIYERGTLLKAVSYTHLTLPTTPYV